MSRPLSAPPQGGAPIVRQAGGRRPQTAENRPLSAGRVHNPRVVRRTSATADSRHGTKTGGNCFIGTESRFMWQRPTNDYEAFYDLPSTLSSKRTGFGSSTREDWEGTVKNKRDGENPNAGPGNYSVGGITTEKLSTNRAIQNVVFGRSARKNVALDTLSPGPAYDVDGAWNNGGRNKQVSPGFNKDQRRGMNDGGGTNPPLYYPQPPTGRSVTIAQRYPANRGAFKGGPGPVYNTTKYDFKTGPAFSFGVSKTRRFVQRKRLEDE